MPGVRRLLHGNRNTLERLSKAVGKDAQGCAFATDLSDKGLEAHFVSELLGHSSVKVTEQFHINRRQVEACRRALRVIEGGRRKES